MQIKPFHERGERPAISSIENRLHFDPSAKTREAAYYFCRFFRVSVSCIMLFCSCAQLWLDASAANLFALAIELFVGLPLVLWLADPRKFWSTPLAALITLTFPSINLLAPVVLATIEWKPVTYHLSKPYLTFGSYGLLSVIIILALISYQKMRPLATLHRGVRKLLGNNLFVFASPSYQQIWVMGSIGLLTLVYSTVAGSAQDIGVSKKLADAFIPYTYLPALILFPHLLGRARYSGAHKILFLGLYFLALLVLGIAVNSRAYFGTMLITPALCGLLACLTGFYDVRKLSVSLRATIIIIALISVSLLGQLALAMQVARSGRGSLSLSQMFNETRIIASSGGETADYLNREDATFEWSETYLTNPLFNRLLSVKFTDNCFALNETLSLPQRHEFALFTFQRILTYLPDPILRRLPLNIDKEKLIKLSYGDYLLYLSRGYEEAMGGFRTGALIPNGFLVFGYWFPLVFFFGCLTLYWLFELFVHNSFGMDFQSDRVAKISPIMLMFIYTAAFYLQSECITDMAGLIVRVLPQTTIFYAGLYFGTRWLNSIKTR